MPGQGCIAQLEEQVPLKHQVESSNLSAPISVRGRQGMHMTFNHEDAGAVYASLRSAQSNRPLDGLRPVGRTWRKEENTMPTIDMAATGLRIKELRDKAGMSTKDIAEVFGFQNPTAVFKWMKGTSLPTVDNLVILADLFGVTIEDILVIRKNENTAVA